jgi:hypothetical protein
MAKKLSDFTTQKANVNRHKVRGMGMLDNVIAKDGWQGAITTAANGETFAGSARLEVAQERFGDESEPIVFDIDGTRPVILRRVDIPTADDPRAIRLGIADNRISELNYDPDIELLSAIAEEVDISDMYFEDELAALVEADRKEDEDEQKEEKSLEEKKPTSSDDDYSVFELIMIHDNKLYLLETLNKVKEKFLYDKQEDALMQILREFNDGY